MLEGGGRCGEAGEALVRRLLAGVGRALREADPPPCLYVRLGRLKLLRRRLKSRRKPRCLKMSSCTC